MAKFVKGKDFGSTEQVTEAKLEQLIESAEFGVDAYDGTSINVNGNGSLQIKGDGVTASKIADNAVQPEHVDETATGEWDMLNIRGKKVRNRVHTDDASGTLAIDMANGNLQVFTLTGNVTAVSALANAVAGQPIEIWFINDASTAYTITGWDSSWKFVGSTDPTNTAATSAVDVVSGRIITISGSAVPCVTMVKNFG